MASLKHDRSGDDPAGRLRHLRGDDVGQAELTALLHELQVHQEELGAQNSQLIETQHALEESRDRYVDLYDFAPIGYMTITGSGIVREMNLTGAALLQKERSKIVGLPFNGFIAAADKPRFAEHLRECRQVDRTNAAVELTLNTSPASHVQLVTRRQAGNADRSPVFLSALIDITERKRLEQERHDAEETRDRLSRDREIASARADAKDHFLATLSHELRTPLTPVVATMSNSRLISLAPEPLLTALQTVRRNLDLEVRLIDDLLDVTRISRHRLVLARERVDIHVLLKDVVDMLGQEARLRNIHVDTALEAPTHWVIGDPTRLRQVFWNLLGNAIKFTGTHGRIWVTSSAAPAGFLRFSVGDTGAGMDESVVHSINEGDPDDLHGPIQSPTGLGLGLAICRGVVTAHGGTLRAVSAGEGRGSTFVVEIPIAAQLEQWAQPTGPIEAPAALQTRPKHILLVEDHEDSADTLSQLLTYQNYEVSVARTMEAAIALAEQGFDLLISDIRLPDGNGLDLMRRIQSTRPLRGIALSGFGTEEDVRRSQEAGYELHLTKPVDFDRLLDAIEHSASSGSGRSTP